MKKYFTALKNSFAEEKYFKFNFYSSFLTIPVKLAVIYYFWFIAMGENTFYGYDGKMIISYFLAMYLVQICTSPAMFITFELFNEINKGTIISWILKPLSYPLLVLSKNIAKFIPRFVVTIVIVLVLPFFWNNTVSATIVGGISIVLGYLILFELQFLIGSLSLKMKNVLRLRDNIMDILMILGGVLIPIDFMPSILKNLAFLSPIPYIFYLPAKILAVGAISQELQSLLIIQMIWGIVLAILIKVSWKVLVVDSIKQGG